MEKGNVLNTKEGIGLGLHISKKIAQEFGGDINFTSNWGEGTTFTFVLALDKNIQTLNEVARNKNPKLKSYPKIEVIR